MKVLFILILLFLIQQTTAEVCHNCELGVNFDSCECESGKFAQIFDLEDGRKIYCCGIESNLNVQARSNFWSKLWNCVKYFVTLRGCTF